MRVGQSGFSVAAAGGRESVSRVETADPDKITRDVYGNSRREPERLDGFIDSTGLSVWRMYK